eukprot:1330960-Rhodomonas_salina.1
MDRTVDRTAAEPPATLFRRSLSTSFSPSSLPPSLPPRYRHGRAAKTHLSEERDVTRGRDTGEDFEGVRVAEELELYQRAARSRHVPPMSHPVGHRSRPFGHRSRHVGRMSCHVPPRPRHRG